MAAGTSETSYPERCARFLTAYLLAALLVAMLEFVGIVLVFPALGSDGLGGALAYFNLASVYLVYAAPLSFLSALLSKSQRWRLLTAPLLLAASATLLVGVALALAFRRFEQEPFEFPEHVEPLKLLATAVVCFGLGLFAILLHRGLEKRIAGEQAAGRVRRALLGAAGLALLGLSQFAAAPVHAATIAASLNLSSLVFFALVLEGLVAEIPAFRWLGGIYGLFFVVMALPLPGQAHARFIFYSHASSAGQLGLLVSSLFDWDEDGSVPTWIGGSDCQEGNAEIAPLRREVIGDGVDQDCRGGDAAKRSAPPTHDEFRACGLGQGPRSVLLVSIDSFPHEALTPEITPNLYEFSRYGFAFERAYSASAMTITSLASMLSGRPLSDLGPQNPLYEDTFDFEIPTLAQSLKASGFRTTAICPFGVHAFTGRGFDALNAFWHDPHVYGPKAELSAVAVTRGLLDFVLEPSLEPFFGWVHYADAHAPYFTAASEASLGRHPGREGHARGLGYVDAQIGVLLSRLKQTGLLEKTVVAVTADHGEELLERGRQGHGPNLFEESVHVPLLVWAPGCPAERIQTPVTVTELAATLARFAGSAHPGRHLFARDDLPVVVEAPTGMSLHFKRAIIMARHKLIVDVPSGGRVLFDLIEDPKETRDIYRENASARTELEALYQRWLDAVGQR